MMEKKLLINSLEVNYKIAGEGPAILVLHGWGGSSNSWVKVQDILSDQGYQLICPDFPGFGRSTPPPEPWGIKDYADFVLKFTQRLGLENFFLIGHSFGGRIAVKFSVMYPEKIKKLILSNSAGIKPKPSLKLKVVWRVAKVGNVLLTPRHMERFKDGAKNVLYIFLRNRDYVKAKGVMQETIKKVLDEDLLPDLSEIKNKTLIVWGQKDKLVPVKYAYIFKNY